MDITQKGGVKAKKKLKNDEDTYLVASGDLSEADGAGKLSVNSPSCPSGLDASVLTVALTYAGSVDLKQKKKRGKKRKKADVVRA